MRQWCFVLRMLFISASFNLIVRDQKQGSPLLPYSFSFSQHALFACPEIIDLPHLCATWTNNKHTRSLLPLCFSLSLYIYIYTEFWFALAYDLIIVMNHECIQCAMLCSFGVRIFFFLPFFFLLFAAVPASLSLHSSFRSFIHMHVDHIFGITE